jgi:hypothetical protein
MRNIPQPYTKVSFAYITLPSDNTPMADRFVWTDDFICAEMIETLRTQGYGFVG